MSNEAGLSFCAAVCAVGKKNGVTGRQKTEPLHSQRLFACSVFDLLRHAQARPIAKRRLNDAGKYATMNVANRIRVFACGKGGGPGKNGEGKHEMKIAMIHGQNHKGSSCHIGRMLAAQFPGSQISEFFLPKDLEHFCVGCYACIEEEADCPYYAEKKRITDAIEAADLLIFTTPTYCMRASAPMKSLIDLTFTYWMSHKPMACMFGKKAVVISTAAGSGAKSAVKDIANALFYWGVPYVKKYGISVQAMGWAQVSEKKKARIEKDMKKLAGVIAEKKDVRVGLKTRLMFGLMRKMQIKGLGASPKEKAYWENNGWLAAGRPWKPAGKQETKTHGAQR